MTPGRAERGARRRGGAFLAVAAALWLLAVPGVAGAQEADHPGGELRHLTRPGGVTLSYIHLRPPERPVASVVLFTGGEGVLGLSTGWIAHAATNFLVRNRARFAGHGFVVAVVDAPSNRQSGLGRFRASAEHAADVQAVIAALRAELAAPVWLVGTSRGTVSAANAAARLREGGPDGLVLTASVVRGWGASLADLDLAGVRVPTLVVHHRHDDCPATPHAGAGALLGRLGNAPRREFLTFDGGEPARGDVCGPLSAHGFLGLDADVVRAIADWIKAEAAR